MNRIDNNNNMIVMMIIIITTMMTIIIIIIMLIIVIYIYIYISSGELFCVRVSPAQAWELGVARRSTIIVLNNSS